ncbi:hypothetical protein Y032_0021g430 [Ancylostoma ceylanicum]|uniref:Uncharacterized protein n=1 Tax=Ancylostoma ceylanicum TaxID=53326 RepID=A0A016V1A4_9BILA|nr:hypothetical protein Y032_0021g430 [Ancylostoma ceylanicum]
MTLIGTLGPPVMPICLTPTVLSTNRPCIMGLTLFEFKQMGVTGGPVHQSKSPGHAPFPFTTIHTPRLIVRNQDFPWWGL